MSRLEKAQAKRARRAVRSAASPGSFSNYPLERTWEQQAASSKLFAMFRERRAIRRAESPSGLLSDAWARVLKSFRSRRKS